MKVTKADLTKYYNSKMFVHTENNEIFDKHPFNGDMDRLFSFSSSLDMNFFLDDVEITLDVYNDDSPDNVICEGQTVQIKPGIYSKILLSGFCMLGCFEDKINIEYIDGSTEYKTIFLYSILESDFYYSNLYNNFSAHNCKQLYKYTNKSDKELYIWSCVVEIENNKTLKSITLPNNELIQIFNISLLS